MKRFLVGVVAVVGFGVAFAACTKKKDENSVSTLRLAVSAKIKGLDPADASDLYSSTQIAQTYEGLLEYHYLKRPYTLIPNLAESMPEVSRDRKVYTFKIRQGVLFQDDPAFKELGGKGRELTAEDFVYSFKRLADPKVMSSGWWLYDGRIVGLNEWREESQKSGTSDYSKKIEGLQALDRYTLRIQLTSPSAQFLYYIAMPFSFVVAREAVEHYGKDFHFNPVGTGPFVLDRRESNLNNKLVWNKNPTYREKLYPSEGVPGDKEAGYLADSGKRLPLVDRLIYDVMVEAQPAWLNFLAGKLDSAVIPKDNFQQAITPSKDLAPDLKEKGIVLLKEPTLDVTHESFNMVDPLLGKNKALRQAISMAHDINPIIELFYNGRAIAAQGPIPPGLAGYDPAFKNQYRKFDLAQAKKLLEKAGYPDGKGLPVFEYSTTDSSQARQMSEYFSKSMAALGIRIKVNSYTWPQFQEIVKNKKGQMWGFAWGADYPDAENFLQLFYSKNVSPGPNDANYSNPEYDRLYEQALTLQDGPARTKLYQKMRDLVVEDAPWIWGVHRVTYQLHQAWLKNLKLHEFENGYAKYLRVDASVKAKYGK